MTRQPRWRLGITVLALMAAGCDRSPILTTPESPAVRVTFQGAPMADIELRLHVPQSGAVVARGVTNTEGLASFPDPPSPEPSEYSVSMESHGDGGWMLRPNVIRRELESLRLRPLRENNVQSVELPADAIEVIAP